MNLEQALEIMISAEAAFPLIICLLILAMTFPVTSASAERSFSALKRIKIYLISTMHQDRLCHLAILSIERTLSGSLDMDKVIDKFDEQHLTNSFALMIIFVFKLNSVFFSYWMIINCSLIIAVSASVM